MQIFAHSLPGSPNSDWETLPAHLQAVALGAQARAGVFRWGPAGFAAGMLHDIGKASAAFQAYIRGEAPSPDHSTAGAVEALRLYGPQLGRVLAFLSAGHHAGLADGTALDARLARASALPDYSGWGACVTPPPRDTVLACPPPCANPQHRGFSEAFLTRMLFSCLVDADFVETERFYAAHEGRTVERTGFGDIATLAERLRVWMAGHSHEATEVNRLRARVLDHAIGKAPLAPGLFTLTVPTGGGKTLTSLAFALEHARIHDLRRVVYVVPFTSIIEQTAQVFRDALERSGDAGPTVLEHHASADRNTDNLIIDQLRAGRSLTGARIETLTGS